jgi:translocation and assembly module TamA
VSPQSRGLATWLCALLAATPLWAASPRVQVLVEGLQEPLLGNVLAFLSIQELDTAPLRRLLPRPSQDSTQGGEVGERQVRRLHRLAPEEIRQALRPFGHYRPQVESSLEDTGSGWLATYRVDPGPVVRLSRVELQVLGVGRDNARLTQLLGESGLQVGDPLNHGTYEAFKRRLLRAALRQGFLDAGYRDSQILVDPEADVAKILLSLDTGPRFHFGPVRLHQDILDPDFLQRYVEIEPDDHFDSEQLVRLQSALASTNWFELVEVVPDRRSAENNRIPVDVNLTPGKRRVYAFGGGYATDTGPRASAGVYFRRINRRGHRISNDVRVSRVLKTVESRYRIPVGRVVTDVLQFSAGYDQEDVGDGHVNRYRVGAMLNESWGADGRRLSYLRYEHESFRFGSGNKDNLAFLIPGRTWSQRSADSAVFARSGYRWSFDLRGALSQVLANTTFLRTEVNLGYVLPVGERGRLLLRGDLGGMLEDEFDKVPTSERFLTGGDRTVRGYGYQKLSPTDDNGEAVGGRYLAVASLEMDYLLYRDFGAAVFFDAGNADDDFPPDPKAGVGVGFRWRSPVGMVRFDIAHPLDNDAENYRIHVSFGPDV